MAFYFFFVEHSKWVNGLGYLSVVVVVYNIG